MTLAVFVSPGGVVHRHERSTTAQHHGCVPCGNAADLMAQLQRACVPGTQWSRRLPKTDPGYAAFLDNPFLEG